jgi:hypothetical protein
VDQQSGRLTELTVYDVYSAPPYTADIAPFHYTTTMAAASPDTFVSMADFGETWYLFSGGILSHNVTETPVQVFKTRWMDSTKIFRQETICINTGCAFRGRLMMGGFDDVNTGAGGHGIWDKWGTTWANLLDYGATWGMSCTYPGQNWVWWSQIGGGDTMMFFDPTTVQYGLENATLRAVDGQYDLDNPIMLEYFRRVQSGFMPMPFQGLVKRMVPFADSVVVYGTDGIAGLRPASVPVPTFGLVETMAGPGIICAGAVDGDERRQVYVGRDGDLWQVTPDLKVERIGGREHLKAMDLLNTATGQIQYIRVCYNKVKDEFYISGPPTAALLSTTDMLVLDKNGFRFQKYPIRGILHSPDVYTCSGWGLQEDDDIALVDTATNVTEVLVNGTFTGSLASWTPGTGWAYGANVAVHTGAALGSLYQVPTDMVSGGSGWIAGMTYKVTFTMSGLGAGAYVLIGGHPFTEAGYYAINITPTSSADNFIIAAYGGVTVDNVTCKALSDQVMYWESGVIQVQGANPKTVREIQLVGDLGSLTLYATLKYKLKTTGAEISTAPIAFDNRGIVRMKVACRSFRLCLTAASSAGISIDDLIVVFEDGSHQGLSNITA